MAQAREVARNDALGDAGDWIRSYVVKGRPMEVVMTNDVWAAALAVAGDGGDGTTAFGLKRTAFIKRVGQLTGGGSAKSHWTGNRSARG